ncbi:hypothetical protein B0H67DRAFT_558120 [Lasiosphaeris hirsuta]|uniref:Transmembrane protein n=1 Tax=Lasiosphaeris hirsuta TaxID=260670 RepID=A0AA39ZXM7_9PEZI|nr:hypothetical protein B0H67DRAFT_558120 [Lasiosphaeris hirsuta]
MNNSTTSLPTYSNEKSVPSPRAGCHQPRRSRWTVAGLVSLGLIGLASVGASVANMVYMNQVMKNINGGLVWAGYEMRMLTDVLDGTMIDLTLTQATLAGKIRQPDVVLGVDSQGRVAKAWAVTFPDGTNTNEEEVQKILEAAYNKTNVIYTPSAAHWDYSNPNAFPAGISKRSEKPHKDMPQHIGFESVYGFPWSESLSVPADPVGLLMGPGSKDVPAHIKLVHREQPAAVAVEDSDDSDSDDSDSDDSDSDDSDLGDKLVPMMGAAISDWEDRWPGPDPKAFPDEPAQVVARRGVPIWMPQNVPWGKQMQPAQGPQADSARIEDAGQYAWRSHPRVSGKVAKKIVA